MGNETSSSSEGGRSSRGAVSDESADDDDGGFLARGSGTLDSMRDSRGDEEEVADWFFSAPAPTSPEAQGGGEAAAQHKEQVALTAVLKAKRLAAQARTAARNRREAEEPQKTEEQLAWEATLDPKQRAMLSAPPSPRWRREGQRILNPKERMMYAKRRKERMERAAELGIEYVSDSEEEEAKRGDAEDEEQLAVAEEQRHQERLDAMGYSGSLDLGSLSSLKQAIEDGSDTETSSEEERVPCTARCGRCCRRMRRRCRNGCLNLCKDLRIIRKQLKARCCTLDGWTSSIRAFDSCTAQTRLACKRCLKCYCDSRRSTIRKRHARTFGFLDLSEDEVDELFSAFKRLGAVTSSGRLKVADLIGPDGCDFDQSPVWLRVLTLVVGTRANCRSTKAIDFRSFVIVVWQLCTLRGSEVYRFLFALYATSYLPKSPRGRRRVLPRKCTHPEEFFRADRRYYNALREDDVMLRVRDVRRMLGELNGDRVLQINTLLAARDEPPPPPPPPPRGADDSDDGDDAAGNPEAWGKAWDKGAAAQRAPQRTALEDDDDEIISPLTTDLHRLLSMAGQLSMRTFVAFAESRDELFRPVVYIQQQLRRNIVGWGFWYRLEQRRRAVRNDLHAPAAWADMLEELTNLDESDAAALKDGGDGFESDGSVNAATRGTVGGERQRDAEARRRRKKMMRRRGKRTPKRRKNRGEAASPDHLKPALRPSPAHSVGAPTDHGLQTQGRHVLERDGRQRLEPIRDAPGRSVTWGELIEVRESPKMHSMRTPAPVSTGNSVGPGLLRSLKLALPPDERARMRYHDAGTVKSLKKNVVLPGDPRSGADVTIHSELPAAGDEGEY